MINKSDLERLAYMSTIKKNHDNQNFGATPADQALFILIRTEYQELIKKILADDAEAKRPKENV